MVTNRVWMSLMAILVQTFLLLEAQAQEAAIKTNALYLLTGTMNIGGELATGEQTSLSLQVQYHPWEWGNNKKMKHIWVQPEYRYWWKGVFTGSFMGIHLNWANYNIAKMPPITTLKNHRYQGNAIGCGLTYGYQWLLGTYWNLETSVSAGYLHLHYKRYGPEKNDPMEKESYSNYIGPYQVGVTLTYFLR
ncbi:MAG: DUF3575 domain-containing protein [Phocaeicola plebeius]|nr:DUF3575 domain-containing protein [Phocaeicola plebeius]